MPEGRWKLLDCRQPVPIVLQGFSDLRAAYHVTESFQRVLGVANVVLWDSERVTFEDAVVAVEKYRRDLTGDPNGFWPRVLREYYLRKRGSDAYPLIG